MFTHIKVLEKALPGILRRLTVIRVRSPVMMLNIVRVTNAVDAVRKTKEKRYMRGMMAQPYNINNRNK